MSNDAKFWRSSTVFLFQLMFFIVPFVWSPVASELFEFPKMLLVYVFTWLILLSWLIRMITEKRFIFKKTPLDLPLLLFLASQVVATVFSIDVHTSLIGYYSRFNGGLYSTLSYIVLYYAFVSNVRKKDVQPFLMSMLIGGVGASLYAFPEHFGASPSCLMITGQADVACWVQDVQTRVFGTFGQPNWLAAYLISIIFIPFGYILSLYNRDVFKSDNLWKMIWSIFSSLLFFTVLLFTKSRSGLLGFSVGLGVFFGFYLYRLRFKPVELMRRSMKVLTASLVMLGLFLIFGRGIVPQADSLIDSVFSKPATQSSQVVESESPPPAASGTQLEVGGTQSIEIRKIVWKGALHLWKKYPLFGSGVETFAYGYYNVRPVEHNLVSEWDFLYNKAHNEFLNILSTSGLFGFVTYIWFIIAFIVLSVKEVLKKDGEHPVLVGALVAGYISLAISNYFGFSTVMVSLIYFLFPAIVVVLSEKKKEMSDEAPEWLLYGGVLLLMMVSLYSLVKIGTAYAADLIYAKGVTYVETNQLQPALETLSRASKMQPNEPNYSDQLSLAAAKSATALQSAGQATAAAQMAQQAHALSNETIKMNDVHVNFYKNRIRVFILLSQLDSQYVQEALRAFQAALTLSPTDAKLWFNLGLLYEQTGEEERAIEALEKAVNMKANYEGARLALAQLYEENGEEEKAQEQYLYILERINPGNEVAREKVER